MPTEPRRPRSATVLFAAALLLFVVGSVVAWWQPPRLFPLKPQTTAEGWLQARFIWFPSSAWEPGLGSSGFPKPVCDGKLELPLPRSQAELGNERMSEDKSCTSAGQQG